MIYAKRSNTLVGKGIVTGDYVFDDLRQEYKSIRAVSGYKLANGNILVMLLPTLTDITPYTDYIEKLTAIFALDELDDVDTQPEIDYPIYSSTDFLTDVYMNEQDYKTLVNVLKMKKNIILQGAPGVGKHLLPSDLPIPLSVQKIHDRVQMIQFHQSYSYEDFIEGYRPTENGIYNKKRLFLQILQTS
mgnify:CR=1 FL=1